jgi:hypothetical protein
MQGWGKDSSREGLTEHGEELIVEGGKFLHEKRLE